MILHPSTRLIGLTCGRGRHYPSRLQEATRRTSLQIYRLLLALLLYHFLTLQSSYRSLRILKVIRVLLSLLVSDRDHGMVRVGSSCGMWVLESDVIQANCSATKVSLMLLRLWQPVMH